jgi:hypothetical protein
MKVTNGFQSTENDRVGKFLDILQNQGVLEEYRFFINNETGIWLYGTFHKAKAISIFQYLEWLHIQEQEKLKENTIKIENSDIQDIEFSYV